MSSQRYKGNKGIIFSYLRQPPKKYTFEMPRVKRWVEERTKGYILNLFAGKVRLRVNEVRVDLNNDLSPDYCMEAYEFVKTWKGKLFDTVILDPPYNERKAREKYNGRHIGKFTKLKNILPSIMSENSRTIIFGYDTTGMGKTRGFLKREICIINHSGDYNDTLVVLEERIGSLNKWIQNKKD